MRRYETANIEIKLNSLSVDERLWVYNGFDVMLPLEIHAAQHRLLTKPKRRIYDFERAMLGPAMQMSFRGVLTDENEVARHIREHTTILERLRTYIRSLAVAIWDDGLNPNSSDQMSRFFYELPSNVLAQRKQQKNDGLMLKPIYGKGQRGERKITCDIKALEKIKRDNYYVGPIVKAILALKEVDKRLQFLRRGIDPDRRFRCTFNVAGTKTGRWSSSTNPFGTGSNFQNFTDKLRTIFIPDPGFILGYPDLEQAESRGVAYLSGDAAYIEACESGDLHTAVARMVWPDLPWTGDLARDREIAESPYYRHFSYRDMSKRGGHALNYMGGPWTLARNLAIETKVAEDFQSLYFGAFPGIPRWHAEIVRQLQTQGWLESPLGRRRTFFARLDSEDTHKKAIASVPQGLISDLCKLGTYRIWQKLDLPDGGVQILGDVHDGVVLQLDETRIPELGPKIISLMTIPIPVGPRTMTIPVDLTIGWRWTKDPSSGSKMVHWTQNPGPRPDSLTAILQTNLEDVVGPQTA